MEQNIYIEKDFNEAIYDWVKIQMSYNQLYRTIDIDIGISLELLRPFRYKIMNSITYFFVGFQGCCT